MKKSAMLLGCAAFACAAFADEPAEMQGVEAEKGDPIVWGFGNYGMYSGYQLYGSLLNSEPTLQGYVEVNFNLPWSLGYVGVGTWSNTDLTDKRRDLYGKAFNEWDPNVHYGKTFWFDNDKKWGLDYRTAVVWYYYPHGRGHDHKTHPKTHFQYGHDTMTTMDWNHSFQLFNPYVVPFFDWIHEYHENKANLWQFGLKKDIKVAPESDFWSKLTLTPSATFVVRSRRYNWCFPTAGWTETHNGGLATMKLMLEGNYAITENFGIFAKVAYVQTLDNSLRDAADHGGGGDYGQYKDFAWGGIGLTVSF